MRLVEIGFKPVVGSLHSRDETVDEGLGPVFGQVCLCVAEKDRSPCKRSTVVGMEVIQAVQHDPASVKEDTNNTVLGRTAKRPAEGPLGVDRAVFRECLFALQRIGCLMVQGDDEGQTKAQRRGTLLWWNRVN